MKNNKICIIGNGLAGLTTAIVLKDHNIDIDVYYEEKKLKANVDKRTTAISSHNYLFLKKNINNLNQNLFWPNKKINLFKEEKNKFFNFLNFEDKKSIIYIFENYKLKSLLAKISKKIKINLIKKKITDIKKISKQYDLIILCLGNNSNLYDELGVNRSIKKNYNETSLTGYIEHDFKNMSAKQHFLKEGPLAILPFAKKKFSFVWSIKNKYFYENKENLKNIIIQNIQRVLNTKKNLIISNFQHYPIKLDVKTKYYNKNTLILGEGLHSIHPLAGQGFNLVLRDIRELKDVIKNNLSLGFSLKDSLLLEKFYQERKSENILISLGVDLTRNFFKKNSYFDPIKNLILKNIGRNNTIKNLSKAIADKGIHN